MDEIIVFIKILKLIMVFHSSKYDNYVNNFSCYLITVSNHLYVFNQAFLNDLAFNTDWFKVEFVVGISMVLIVSH